MADIGLNALTGANGLSFSTNAIYDRIGHSLSIAGDINGDGIDDLIVGAPANTSGTNSPGKAFIVFGHQGWTSSFDLSTVTGANGFILTGNNAGDWLGLSVNTAGDLNNDGRADILIGAPGEAASGFPDAGKAYVLFGQAAFAPITSVSQINHGANGLIFTGLSQNDLAGWSVDSGQDFNGDGRDDLLIGTNGANGTKGAAYVVFGRANWGAAPINLESLSGLDGIKLSGINAGDLAGKSVAFGDVNGDNLADAIIGAPGSDFLANNAGETYVVFGNTAWGWTGGNVSLGGLNGNNGFVIRGVDSNAGIGHSVSSGTDVNGDGIDDILVGAPTANPGGGTEGAAFTLFGRANWSTTGGGFRVTNLNGSNGFQVTGNVAGGRFGESVTMAGDINNDGFGDIMIGAPNASTSGDGSGLAFMIFGGDNLNTATITSGGIAGVGTLAAFRFLSADGGSHMGSSVGLGGDINGDGVGDMVMGEPDFGNKGGKAYAFFGRSGWGPPSLLQSLPTNTETQVDPSASLVMVFSEPVWTQTGVIEIRELDNFGKLAATVDITSPQVLGSGTETIIATLGTTLKDNTRYYVLMNSGTLKDAEGLSFKGFNKATDYVFTTGTAANSTAIPVTGGIIYDPFDLLRLPTDKAINDLILRMDSADMPDKVLQLYQPFGSSVTKMVIEMPLGTQGKEIILPATGSFTNVFVQVPPTIDQYNFPPTTCTAVTIRMNQQINALVLIGTGEANVIGTAYVDNIEGNSANNCIWGRGSTDRIKGGSGFDALYGDSGNDIIYGNWDSDWIFGGTGTDRLYGGQGNDRIFGNQGDDWAEGNRGNDYLSGDLGNDTLEGKSDADTIVGGPGTDFLIGGPGTDYLEGNSGRDVIHGSKGNDIIYGNYDVDVLYGDEDRDAIYGGTGSDHIYGGSGGDTIDGGPQADAIFGGSGADFIWGGTGRDIIYGNKDADLIRAGAQDDLMYGGSGGDRLSGQQGNDTAFSGLGADVIYGNTGNDLMYGGGGDDFLFGGPGSDTIHGGQGNDWIKGNNGDDILSGNRGYDTYFGGSGADNFYFSNDPNHDTIVDFIPVQGDMLTFWPSIFATPDEALANMTQLTIGVRFTSPAGHTLTLLNKTVDQITVDQIFIVEYGMGI